MARQILIIGNHRTGSSCVAGVLYKAGISMGKTMLGAHRSNPVGHFEDKAFLLLNESLVAPWHTPVILSEDELAVPRIRYERLIKERDEQTSIWGIKDPRLCITAPYFMDLLFDPVIINTKRSDACIVRSLMKRDGWSEEKAVQIYNAYNIEERLTIRQAAEMEIPILQVYFEDLLKDPVKWVPELIDFAADNDNKYLFSRFTEGWRGKSLVDFVQPDLVNYRED